MSGRLAIGLTDFLLDRIAEDAAVAQAGEDDWGVPDGVAYTRVGLGADGSWVHTIDSVRILAECDAKRRIVELHRAEAFEDEPSKWFCTHDQRTAGLWPCDTVRLLALPYADHPDYDESWRP